MASKSYDFPTRHLTFKKESPVGIGLVQTGNMVFVAQMKPDTIAASQLREDDCFVTINGTSTISFNVDQLYDLIKSIADGDEIDTVVACKSSISDAQISALINEEAKLHTIVHPEAVPDSLKNMTLTEVLQSTDTSDPLHKTVKSAIYDMTVPLTTRAPREGETDGKEYHFVTVADFKRLVNEGKMMEYGQKNGVMYGTLKLDASNVKLRRASMSKTVSEALTSKDATLQDLIGDDAPTSLSQLTIHGFLKKVPSTHPEHGAIRKKVQALVYDLTVPYTTRNRREGEADGREYHFVSGESFAQLAKNNFFMEIGTNKQGVYYGTPKISKELAQRKSMSRRSTMKQALANGPNEATIAEILKKSGTTSEVASNVAASRFLASTDPAHPELADIRTQIKLAIYDLTVPLTTRAPREGERNGVDYNFVSREQFEDYIQSNQMLEYGEKNGIYYGTLKVTKEEIAQGSSPRRRSTMRAALDPSDQKSPAATDPAIALEDATWSETLV